MRHPCLSKNTHGHDYTKLLLKIQMPQIVDVTYVHKKKQLFS